MRRPEPRFRVPVGTIWQLAYPGSDAQRAERWKVRRRFRYEISTGRTTRSLEIIELASGVVICLSEDRFLRGYSNP